MVNASTTTPLRVAHEGKLQAARVDNHWVWAQGFE
jgi:hypothetical protein